MGEDWNVKRDYLGRFTVASGIAGASNWREIAHDRNNWRNFVSEAEPHFKSLSQRSKH